MIRELAWLWMLKQEARAAWDRMHRIYNEVPPEEISPRRLRRHLARMGTVGRFGVRRVPSC